jgi:hypothetical protein
MSIIQFPTTLKVAKQSWIQQRNDVEFRSMFGAQAVEASGPLWSSTITAPTDLSVLAGPWQSLMLQLRGRTNQLALWNMGRPVPLGTMRGSMTLGTTAQGATSLAIATGTDQAATTLLAGDFLGVGSGVTQQVVMVLFDAVADGSGNIAVTTEPPLNNAFVSGSVVTWNMPCALFRRKASTLQWDYEPLMVSGLMLDLLEDVRP